MANELTMPNTREKLIELLKQAPFEGKVLDEWWWEDKIARIADHLIANGVTIANPPFMVVELPEEQQENILEQLRTSKLIISQHTEPQIEVINQQGWIPVTERLPEDDLPTDTKRLQIKVLVTTNHKGKKFVRVVTRERWEFPVGNMRPWIWSKDATNVTHWMPLPEPPKGE